MTLVVELVMVLVVNVNVLEVLVRVEVVLVVPVQSCNGTKTPPSKSMSPWKGVIKKAIEASGIVMDTNVKL